jgi:ABC-type sugar transport system substrate-binding protein
VGKQARNAARHLAATALSADQSVWAANDEMAFGMEEAIRQSGKQTGKTVLLSAINNSPRAAGAA